MSVSQRQRADVAVGTAPPAAGSPRRRLRVDLAMAVACLAGAAWLTGSLWVDPDHRVIRVNAGDQALFEWLLAYAANAVAHGHNPLWTDILNVPDGVNLAVNTANTVHGILLAPITLTLGPPVAFAVALTANLAGSAFAWYLFLSRAVRLRPAAAVVGGLFCGFAPGIVTHANGHLNFTAQFLIPLILARVYALRRPGHAVRDGALLGLLLTVQYSLGAESLFFTALGCGVFLVAWVLAGHREPVAHWRAFGRGLAVAGAVAAVFLAYPMWLQFLGPQTYHGTGFDQHVHAEDAAAYGAFPRRSLAGQVGLSTRLAPNPTEENSFFGLPLLLLAIGVAVPLGWRAAPGPRRTLVRALATTGPVFAVLSFGPELKFAHHNTPVPLPYAALAHLPLFDSALPARLALVVVPVVGILIGLALDAAASLGPPRRRLVAAATALALLPLVPVPLLVMARSPVPHFISAGTWQRYVRPGETLVPVPPVADLLPDGQRWQATALSTGDGATFRVPGGFFLGPGGPDGRGLTGPVPRPTYALLKDVALTGHAPPIGDREIQAARDDLRYWRGHVVVLPVSGGTGNSWSANHGALLATATRLFGPPTRVDDVWLWQVTTP